MPKKTPDDRIHALETRIKALEKENRALWKKFDQLGDKLVKQIEECIRLLGDEGSELFRVDLGNVLDLDLETAAREVEEDQREAREAFGERGQEGR